MPKILKIEESKITTKNNVEVQRVIFSDDKIVYIKIDDGEVYPKNTPDRYVDLINTYNASHDNIDSTKSNSKSKMNPDEFWGSDRNYIKDGTEDRRTQIENAKSKKHLSKSRDTQRAINRIRDFGNVLRISGIIQIVITVLQGIYIINLSSNGLVPNDIASLLVILFTIDLILGILYVAFGGGIAKLEFKPTAIRAIAIIALIIPVVILILNGWLGILGILVVIYAIIALTKIGRYEEWFYGEIE